MAALDFANVSDRSNGVPGHLPALIRIFMRLLALFPAFMVLIAHAAGPVDARVARARSPGSVRRLADSHAPGCPGSRRIARRI